MGGINWGQSAVSFGTTLMDMLEQGRQRRLQDEQLRQLMAAQAKTAEALRASGTVPPGFGGLLESIPPPPPAQPSETGFMGVLRQMGQDIGQSGRPGLSQLDILPYTSRQQTLEALTREMAAQQAETGREARRAATRKDIAAQQEARFTQQDKLEAQRAAAREEQHRADALAAEARQAQRDREAQAMEARREQSRSELAKQGQLATETRQETSASRREADRIFKERGPEMTKGEMEHFNALIAGHPAWGYKPHRWRESSWDPRDWHSAGAVPIEEGTPPPPPPPPPPDAAATAAKAASAHELTPKDWWKQHGGFQ